MKKLDKANLKITLEQEGFYILNDAYTKKEINQIRRSLNDFQIVNPTKGSNEFYAIRNLFEKIPSLKKTLLNNKIKLILEQIGNKFHLTKAIYFNKPAFSNWYVTWHQDLSIHVKEKIEHPDFHGWTNKKGFIGVIPPKEILSNTITIRVHLDDTTIENGGLKIIPRSHKNILKNQAIKHFTQTELSIDCNVLAGGIQLMKPLLLHASSKSQNNKSRRVIHLEFNNIDLPDGLQWSERESI